MKQNSEFEKSLKIQFVFEWKKSLDIKKINLKINYCYFLKYHYNIINPNNLSFKNIFFFFLILIFL
jgi:hypothetical protein